MAEPDGPIGGDLTFDFPVNSGDRLIGRKEHDEIGRSYGVLDQSGGEAGFFGSPRAS